MYISIYGNYILIGELTDHAVPLSSHEGVVTSEVEHKPPHLLHHSQTPPSSPSLSAGLSGSTVHVCWYIALLDIKKYVLGAFIINSPSLKDHPKIQTFLVLYKRWQVGMF